MYGGSKGVCCAVLSHSVVSLCDPWTVACQAPLSMGFSRQEYWSESSFPSPADLPDSGVEPSLPRVCLCFSTTSYRNTRMKFVAIPM